MAEAWVTPVGHMPRLTAFTSGGCSLLSNAFLENDLVAIQPPYISTNDTPPSPRLCAVRYDGSVAPLCLRQDDVETDLWVDPREYANTFWTDEHGRLTDDCVTATYGEGFYGQRPVPSLGGGPGYGAAADDCWSVEEDVLQRVRQDGVHLPVVDMGMAHGEKARAGAF
jgi:hypothetical protein